eukprot:2939340-Rhodomonas_salina.2
MQQPAHDRGCGLTAPRRSELGRASRREAMTAGSSRRGSQGCRCASRALPPSVIFTLSVADALRAGVRRAPLTIRDGMTLSVTAHPCAEGMGLYLVGNETNVGKPPAKHICDDDNCVNELRICWDAMEYLAGHVDIKPGYTRFRAQRVALIQRTAEARGARHSQQQPRARGYNSAEPLVGSGKGATPTVHFRTSYLEKVDKFKFHVGYRYSYNLTDKPILREGGGDGVWCWLRRVWLLQRQDTERSDY